MRLTRLVLFSSLACAVAGSPLAAQSFLPPRVGIAVGMSSVPGAFHTGCNGESIPYPGVAARLAWPGERLTVESSVGIAGTSASNLCLAVDPAYLDGIHTDRLREVDARQWRANGELLLRWTPLALPVSLQGGAGMLAPGTIPYVTVGAGAATRGSVPVRLDVRRRWLSVPYTQVTREWENGEVVRVLGEDRTHEVWGGWVVQLGAELRVR